MEFFIHDFFLEFVQNSFHTELQNSNYRIRITVIPIKTLLGIPILISPAIPLAILDGFLPENTLDMSTGIPPVDSQAFLQNFNQKFHQICSGLPLSIILGISHFRQYIN